MTREKYLLQLEDPGNTWDMIVIGGGASGLGTAVEAASRGYRTILLEQYDFAKGTSSRSTKLIHGGVRYLKQGNLALVLEALHERGLLMRNAPHLVQNLSFVVPLYDWWEGPFYGVGLKLYDMFAGKLGIGPSRHLSREETLDLMPTLEPGGLRGGIVYHDGQFDDSRLAISLARTLEDLGGTPLNYMQVTGILKQESLSTGVTAIDSETGREYKLRSRVVINAAGVFADEIRRMDDPAASSVITPSQGVHIVLDRSFLPGDSATMVPHTSDNRVLFAVPWHGRVVIGTTDTMVDTVSLEPRPLPDEIDYILSHAARYLVKHPTRTDILSVFAGLRPLVQSGKTTETASISREHSLLLSESGLLTITGGKWTTYRRIGEDAVNHAAVVACLEERPSITQGLRIHGWREKPAAGQPWDVYGSDVQEMERLLSKKPSLGEKLHPDLPYNALEVVWAVRREWARTVEDVLARRTRALFLDAKASMAAAPRVAELMAHELSRGKTWQKGQVADYQAVASGYLPPAL